MHELLNWLSTRCDAELTRRLLAIIMVFGMIARPALAQAPVAPQPTIAPVVAAHASSPSPELLLACATVEELLRQVVAEPDESKQDALLKRADALLRPHLSDPLLDDLAAWRWGGIIAVARQDLELAAHAFEAISRIDSNYTQSPELLKLMGRLNAMDIQERVQKIREDRASRHFTLIGPDQPESTRLFHLGYISDGGHGALKDWDRASMCYRRSAELGDPSAMLNLGLHFSNVATEEGRADGLQWWRKAAFTRRPAVAEWFIDRATRFGKYNAQYMYMAGFVLVYGLGMQENSVEGVAWLMKAAEKDQVEAMHELGLVFSKGRGTAKDDSKAAEWYAKAAEKGSAFSMYCLAKCYDSGSGVAQDKAKAIEWYSKAAEKGHGEANFIVAKAYLHGVGIDKNPQRAFECYSRAAELGSLLALTDLGHCHLQGLGTEKDAKKAFECFDKASSLGNPDAMYFLAMMLEKGNSIAKDENKALEWLTKSAKSGGKLAQDELKRRGVTW